MTTPLEIGGGETVLFWILAPISVIAAMGLLFAHQRRITGGIQASMLTHVVWSALMLRYLPPLFTRWLAEERLTAAAGDEGGPVSP